MNATPSRLQFRDHLLIVACCAALFAVPLVVDRTLTSHETVHCLNIREMRADGDLVIPHYGGRPWLERPPLPFWLTLPVIELFGDHPVAYRLASILVALPCILLVGWIASVWYGRGIGTLSALILATMRQFNHYSTGPEADIFLCTVVTAALALFVRLEWLCPRAGEWWFIGRRTWSCLAFFGVLGLANLVKGLFFGDAFILAPIAAFLLLGERPLERIRRYVWLPGWLLFLLVGASWATAAYLREPGIVDLWHSDYVGRMNTNYMREPAWYYFAHLPWMIFPWVAPAFAGLWLTRSQAFREGRTPERFLWCWALVPLFLFSIPTGKHTHYLLHAMAPWAILGAVGAARLWAYFRERSWLATPWPLMLSVGLPVEVALGIVAWKLGGPGWFLPAVLIVWPMLLLAYWLSLTRRQAWSATAWAFAFSAVLCWIMHVQNRIVVDRYAGDRDLLAQVRKDFPPGGDRLFVLDDWGPLDSSWHLFNLEGRGRLLHNPTFLRTADLDQREVAVLTRRRNVPAIAQYGQCERVRESVLSRGEPSPDFRLGLYRLRFDERVTRHTGPVAISPMQATGRAPGPELR